MTQKDCQGPPPPRPSLSPCISFHFWLLKLRSDRHADGFETGGSSPPHLARPPAVWIIRSVIKSSLVNEDESDLERFPWIFFHSRFQGVRVSSHRNEIRVFLAPGLNAMSPRSSSRPKTINSGCEVRTPATVSQKQVIWRDGANTKVGVWSALDSDSDGTRDPSRRFTSLTRGRLVDHHRLLLCTPTSRKHRNQREVANPNGARPTQV